MDRTSHPISPIAAIAVLGMTLLTAGATQSADAPKPSDAVMATGQHLFADHCAMCHDVAGGRAPARADLAAYAPDEVVEILTNGPMTPMAAGLSADDIRALASYLTSQSPAAPAAPTAPATPATPSPAPGN